MNKIYQKPFPGEKNAGFTLIELLVVVLIIGILSAIALPQYRTTVLKARFKQMTAVAIPVHEALKLAHLEKGEWPVSFDELAVSLPAPLKKESSAGGDKWNYKWGYCALRSSSLGNIQCQMSVGKEHIGMEIFADGLKYCFVSSSFADGHKVCRAETGNVSSSPGATSSSYYKY